MTTFDESLMELLSENYKVKLISTSYLGVTAGDIVIANYGGRERFGFIMSSARSGSPEGLFISSKFNQLLNFVSVETISNEDFLMIVDTMYKGKDLRPILSNFHYVQGSESPVTNENNLKSEFRTFNISKISGSSLIRIQLTALRPSTFLTRLLGRIRG